ncbi:unnamed protein product [Musa hybrid cultivar]
MDDGDDPFASGAADLDMALDLDHSRGLGQRPQRPARFQPRVKGKIKAEPSADPEPPRQPPPAPDPVKKQEAEGDPSASSVSSAPDVDAVATEAMDVDEEAEEEEQEEDSVVREIGVFFTPAPLDEDTYLYVMQYVLRPSWRPYELNERCEEVRVKPKESKIEVDFSIDADSENYDQDAAEPLRLQKQTLSSSIAPLVTSYAVGILRGDQLHLNPIHAVVQLRPSMAHLDTGLQKKKHNAQSAELSTSNDNSMGKLASVGSDEKIEDDEPWISLEYHAVDSHFTERYHRKMVAEAKNQIPFMMKPSDYANSLCPGASSDNKRTKGPSRRLLLTLPLEERLKKWLSEGCQINRFDALMHLAPDSSKEDVLNALPLYAVLVQGLWVSKSTLLYEGKVALVRDFILCLFSRNPIIHIDKLKMIKFDGLKSLMSSLAVERRAFSDWKFKEATDFSFIKKYPDIVKNQECVWSDIEKTLPGFCKSMPMSKSSLNPSSSKRVTSVKVDADAHVIKDRAVSTAVTSMSSETQEHLPKALLKIFQEKRIRSLNSVVHGLRELAISKSFRPRDDSKIKALISAAKSGASAPASELQSIVSQIAMNVHGVYILKSTGNPALDPLRLNVVIDLFRGKEPNAKINKQEIRIAAQTRLKKDISDSEYNQVVHELCVSSRGSWILKSGD